MSELRYHPFLRQWVITASHRQDRTHHPPPDFCPLCPQKTGGEPTEIPVCAYDIAVFENRFPSLSIPPPIPAVAGKEVMPVQPSAGVCEVVCYTQDHNGSFAELPRTQVQKLVWVWRDRYQDLIKRAEVEYVMIFENKGREIGVTLEHPHGQIYGYPFIPPTMATRLESEDRHLEEHGRPLLGDVILEERLDGKRVLLETDHHLVWLPFFARYPYEVVVAPKLHRASIVELTEQELEDLGDCLHRMAQAYDRLFGFSLPYMMAMHQQPKSRMNRTWMHTEFIPLHRSATKLKYLASSESCAGVFINDVLPEIAAQRLRDCF